MRKLEEWGEIAAGVRAELSKSMFRHGLTAANQQPGKAAAVTPFGLLSFKHSSIASSEPAHFSPAEQELSPLFILSYTSQALAYQAHG